MIKELFLAIALGAILGFGITGGFITLNKNKTDSVNKTQTVITTPTLSPSNETPIPTQESEIPVDTITINSPEDESIVNVSKISIKGTASKNDIIIIKTPTKIYNTTADSEGNFEMEINLESGINTIQTTAINIDTNQTSESEILVTYSTAKI